jgi:hypothetical protein
VNVKSVVGIPPIVIDEEVPPVAEPYVTPPPPIGVNKGIMSPYAYLIGPAPSTV